MRDTLSCPVSCNESATVNWDAITNPGTHWVAYMKGGDKGTLKVSSIL